MTEELKAGAEGAAENQEPEQKTTEVPSEDIFETAGRKFNLATPEGRRDLKTWTEAVSSVTGRLAQQKGELEKEVEPLRKYNLKSVTVDEVGALKKVEQYRSEGDHLSADKLMWELYSQQKSDTARILEKERLWSDYKSQNPSVFEHLDEEMSKKYIFGTYSKELEEDKDPFQLIDRVLKPKAAKFAPKKNETVDTDGVPSVLGKGMGNVPASKSLSQKQGSEEKSDGSWDKMLDELGFK